MVRTESGFVKKGYAPSWVRTEFGTYRVESRRKSVQTQMTKRRKVKKAQTKAETTL